jgi:Ni,Fe-hydrogenase III small subunit
VVKNWIGVNVSIPSYIVVPIDLEIGCAPDFESIVVGFKAKIGSKV